MSVITVNPAVPYADITQEIANGFPDWHIVRRQRAALPSSILNIAVGTPFSKFQDTEVPNLFAQKHLSIANVFSNYKAFTIDTSSTTITDKSYNHLRNSNFTEWSNPTRMADYWEVTTEDWMEKLFLIQANPRINYRGGSSISIQSNTDQYFPWGEVSLHQDYELDEADGNTEWSALVHYTPFGVEEIEPNIMVFYMRMTYKDGLTKYVEVPLAQVEDWTKLTLNLTGDKPISTVRIGIKWEPLVATPLFGILVDNFMLYNGSDNVFWNRNPEDKPPFVTAVQDDFTVLSATREGSKSYILTEVGSNEMTKSLLPSSALIGNNFLEPEQTLPDIVADPVQLQSAVWADGTIWNQSAIVATEAVRAKYGWPTWTLGRMIKFDPLHPGDIFATYIPSFPIFNPNDEEEGKVNATDDMYITAMTEHLGKFWVIGKILSGGGLNHVGSYLGILMVMDNILPKQQDTYDTEGPDYENSPMYLPVDRSYLLDVSNGLGFGDIPYADDEWGGTSSPLRQECQKLEFIDYDKIAIRMQLGSEGIIHMKYDYFTKINGDAEIAVLRNYVIDDPGANIIVC